MIDHFAELRHPRSQRLLAVLVEKELRVGQPGPHHALVALDHCTRIVGTNIADHQKPVGQLALAVQQRKVLLVGLHREDQAFLRHFEKFSFELAGQHVRPLDQAGDLVEQLLGVFDHMSAVADLGRGGRELTHDLGAPRFEAGDDGAVFFERRSVAVRVRQAHRVHGGFEAVAAGRVTRLQPQRPNRHHFAAMQRHQRMGWAHELDVAPAVGELVGHYLRDRQLDDRFVQSFLQAFGKGRTFDGAVVEQCFGLAVHDLLQACDSRPIGAERVQLFQQRRRCVAAGIQPHADWHQLLRHGLVAGLRRHCGDVGCEPTRRSERRELRLRRDQALGLELLEQNRGKRLPQLLQRLGRQLLDEQFHQQVFRPHRYAAFFCICATHSGGAIGKPSRSRLS